MYEHVKYGPLDLIWTNNNMMGEEASGQSIVCQTKRWKF